MVKPTNLWKVAQEYPEEEFENFQGQWQKYVAHPSACLRPQRVEMEALYKRTS